MSHRWPPSGAKHEIQGTLSRKTSFCPAQRIGCPILRAVGEGWDATALHPEALARNFCLSHPSRKTRRMGHPILCERARDTRRHHLAISLGFSSPWVGRRPMTPPVGMTILLCLQELQRKYLPRDRTVIPKRSGEPALSEVEWGPAVSSPIPPGSWYIRGSLIGSKRLHWIDGRRTTRGEKTCQHGRCRQDNDRHEQAQRIIRLHRVELTLYPVRAQQRDGHAHS
jgi:hypothetical protein